jgi:hypothetical protein
VQRRVLRRNVGRHVWNAVGFSAPTWLRWSLLFALLASGGGRATAAGVDLSGAWVSLKVLSDSVTFPLVGDVLRTTTLIQRVTIETSGDALTPRSTYCLAEFDNGPALLTTIDSQFLCALEPVTVAAAIDASGCFAQPWSTEVHGVQLDHPETDPLPTDVGDPRVFNGDHDGKPGITVHARAFGFIAGDVYIIQRLRTRLVGNVVSPDRIEGIVEGSVEQVILGATNSLFLGTVTSRPDPVPSHSYFVLRRVNPASTCDEILVDRAGLFGG